jgi:cytochrome c biogenesis protein CcdA
MDWLTHLAENHEVPLLAAAALGLLTAISPCPLATNITATAYIAKTITNRRKVLLSGALYTLGRMSSYTVLAALIYYGVAQFRVARLFQGNGERFIGPLMILIGLILLGLLPLGFLSGGRLTERLSERFKDRGLTGSFLLGMVFALAFCPYSGALFFAMLIPMTLSAGMALPVVFSLGTGLPVLLFAFVIAYSMEKLGSYFKTVQKVEKVMRIVAGATFLLTGLYYLNIYLKVV